ncbi:MAG TPA: HEAT repeat domain-containing protein [Thermoanaerobaculia bacterium]
MWEFFASLLPVLFGASTVWGIRQHNLGRVRAWRDAAEWSDLRVVEFSSPWAWRASLKAKGGPLEVRIEASRRNGGLTSLAIEVPGPPGFTGMKLRREEHRPRGIREIEVGDEAFDSRFFVEGPIRTVFTLLDAEARRLLISADGASLWSKELELAGGEIRAETSDDRLPAILPILLEVGRRFAQPVDVARWDVARRLAENAGKDPKAGVRLSNLLLLVREFPGEPGTVEALRAACSDPSPEIRLRAAEKLDAEGHDVLVNLAESEVDDAVSAQAVSVVGEDLSFERLTAILRLALRRRRRETAHACIEALSRHGEAAVDILAKVTAREQGELAAAAAQALGETGSRQAEPPLIQALQHKNMEVQVAAAKALGRVGSAAAVLPLKTAAERSSRDQDLRRATRQAIAEIQSRLPGASPGQLSLAGEEVGQLSLAGAEAGQLTLAQTEEGQLSLTPGEPGQLSLSETGDEPGET